VTGTKDDNVPVLQPTKTEKTDTVKPEEKKMELLKDTKDTKKTVGKGRARSAVKMGKSPAFIPNPPTGALISDTVPQELVSNISKSKAKMSEEQIALPGNQADVLSPIYTKSFVPGDIGLSKTTTVPTLFENADVLAGEDPFDKETGRVITKSELNAFCQKIREEFKLKKFSDTKEFVVNMINAKWKIIDFFQVLIEWMGMAQMPYDTRTQGSDFKYFPASFLDKAGDKLAATHLPHLMRDIYDQIYTAPVAGGGREQIMILNGDADRDLIPANGGNVPGERLRMNGYNHNHVFDAYMLRWARAYIFTRLAPSDDCRRYLAGLKTQVSFYLWQYVDRRDWVRCWNRNDTAMLSRLARAQCYDYNMMMVMSFKQFLLSKLSIEQLPAETVLKKLLESLEIPLTNFSTAKSVPNRILDSDLTSLVVDMITSQCMGAYAQLDWVYSRPNEPDFIEILATVMMRALFASPCNVTYETYYCIINYIGKFVLKLLAGPAGATNPYIYFLLTGIAPPGGRGAVPINGLVAVDPGAWFFNVNPSSVDDVNSSNILNRNVFGRRALAILARPAILVGNGSREWNSAVAWSIILAGSPCHEQVVVGGAGPAAAPGVAVLPVIPAPPAGPANLFDRGLVQSDERWYYGTSVGGNTSIMMNPMVYDTDEISATTVVNRYVTALTDLEKLVNTSGALGLDNLPFGFQAKKSYRAYISNSARLRERIFRAMLCVSKAIRAVWPYPHLNPTFWWSSLSIGAIRGVDRDFNVSRSSAGIGAGAGPARLVGFVVEDPRATYPVRLKIKSTAILAFLDAADFTKVNVQREIDYLSLVHWGILSGYEISDLMSRFAYARWVIQRRMAPPARAMTIEPGRDILFEDMYFETSPANIFAAVLEERKQKIHHWKVEQLKDAIHASAIILNAIDWTSLLDNPPGRGGQVDVAPASMLEMHRAVEILFRTSDEPLGFCHGISVGSAINMRLQDVPYDIHYVDSLVTDPNRYTELTWTGGAPGYTADGARFFARFNLATLANGRPDPNSLAGILVYGASPRVLRMSMFTSERLSAVNGLWPLINYIKSSVFNLQILAPTNLVQEATASGDSLMTPELQVIARKSLPEVVAFFRFTIPPSYNGYVVPPPPSIRPLVTADQPLGVVWNATPRVIGGVNTRLAALPRAATEAGPENAVPLPAPGRSWLNVLEPQTGGSITCYDHLNLITRFDQVVEDSQTPSQ